MSEVKVNKISPRSGTDVTLGDASDTFTIPASATLDVNGTLDLAGSTMTGFTIPSGQTLAVASSGEIDIASGATLDVNGTIDVTGATLTGFSTNTPYWHVWLDGHQNIDDATATKVAFDTEIYDSASAFSSSKWTCPVGSAGYYFVYADVVIGSGNNYMQNCYSQLYKNGAYTTGDGYYNWYGHTAHDTGRMNASFRQVISLAEGDYLECYGYGVENTADQIRFDGNGGTQFGGFKLL